MRQAALADIEKRAKEAGFRNVGFDSTDVDVANAFLDEVIKAMNEHPAVKTRMLGFIGDDVTRNAQIEVEYRKVMEKELKNAGSDCSEEELDAAVESLMKKIPLRRDDYAVSLNLDVEAPMLSEAFNGISLNPIQVPSLAEFELLIARGVARGEHPQGVAAAPMHYIVNHEVAHQLDDLIGISKSFEFEKIFDRYKGDLKGNVSGYVKTRADEKEISLETVKREFLAEAYAEWKTSESPRKCAQEIGKLVQEMYNASYG